MSFTLDIWELIAFGVGFWMIMDGLVFGMLPETLRRLSAMMSQADEDDLRQAGLISAVIGIVIVYLILSFPAAG